VQYHRTYYAPNNGVVVMAGDVKYEEVKRLAEKYFGPIPAQAPPKEVKTVEPPQKGERRVYVQKASVSTPNIMFAYHVPATSHEDFYALDMLSSILSQGNSSRLYQAMVEKQIALEAQTYMPLAFDPNLFYVMAVADPKTPVDDLEKALISVINDISENGVSAEELEKVKNLKLMEFYRDMETINGKANTVGTYELFFDSYADLFNAPEAYAKVSVEDIQRVAQTYLRKSNRTVGVLAAEEDTDK
jgi:predicted Zn-dependent peptidase